MKPPNRFIKVLVASVFFLLIAAFVAYHSGVFNASNSRSRAQADKILAAHTGYPSAADTFPSSKTVLARIDSAKKLRLLKAPKTILSSSKSRILAEDIWWRESIQPPSYDQLPDYIVTDSGPQKIRMALKSNFMDSLAGKPLRIGSRSSPEVHLKKVTDTIR